MKLASKRKNIHKSKLKKFNNFSINLVSRMGIGNSSLKDKLVCSCNGRANSNSSSNKGT